MKDVTAFPRFLDFTNPQWGHDISINKEAGLLGNMFKIFSMSLYYNPLTDTITKGDVIKLKLKGKDKIALFRILKITEDDNFITMLYCDAVFCGYFVDEPRYFNGFQEEWEKLFPSKKLVTAEEYHKTAKQVYQQSEFRDFIGAIGAMVLFVLVILLCVGISSLFVKPY